MAAQAAVLERAAHTLCRDVVWHEAVYALARKRDPALVDRDEAANGVEQSRLAGPVGADHGYDLAGRDPQIDLRECAQATEPNRYIVERQQRVRICRHLKPDDSARGRAKSGAAGQAR